ncbi:hypothetical protein QTP88_019712 [Uroleucon formosanum]
MKHSSEIRMDNCSKYSAHLSVISIFVVEYFEQLLNGEDPEEIFDCIQEQPNNSEYKAPTVQEIKMQIKRLKNHKSPDDDGIQGEILKCVDKTMIEMIHELIEKIWNSEEIPKDWNMALICPIHKKDDKKECNNCRGPQVGNILSREVQVNTGLKQGDALSPIIFNLVLEKVIRMMNISPDEGVKLDGTSIGILAYADDIVLLGNNINTVKSLCERLITAARRVGLQVNEEKTEFMEICRKRPDIVKEIKRRRLEWAGHVWRKPNANKDGSTRKSKGKRSLGRPRMRWEDCVKKDVADFYPEEDWHTLAQNREGWRLLCLDVCAWDSISVESKTVNNVTSRLLIEELKIQQIKGEVGGQEKSSAFPAKFQNKSSGKNGSYGKGKKEFIIKNKVNCFNCGKIGHYKRECRSYLCSMNGCKITTTDTNLNAFVSESRINNTITNTWVLDSGASDHMTANIEWFSSYETLEDTQQVTIGDGSNLYAIGKSDCIIEKQHRQSFNKSKTEYFNVGDLIHADLCGPMHVKTETGSKIKILRTDNWLEFVNKDITGILQKYGIRHQTTVPYTPE